MGWNTIGVVVARCFTFYIPGSSTTPPLWQGRKQIVARAKARLWWCVFAGHSCVARVVSYVYFIHFSLLVVLLDDGILAVYRRCEKRIIINSGDDEAEIEFPVPSLNNRRFETWFHHLCGTVLWWTKQTLRGRDGKKEFRCPVFEGPPFRDMVPSSLRYFCHGSPVFFTARQSTTHAALRLVEATLSFGWAERVPDDDGDDDDDDLGATLVCCSTTTTTKTLGRK